MSVGPSESGEWHKITSSIEEAIGNAKTTEDLNLRIQSVFHGCPLSEEKSIDKATLDRLNAIEKSTHFPIKAILLANTLFEKVSKENPQEWEDLERKFQLLKDKYPSEFQETIVSLKKRYNFESDAINLKQLLIDLYQSQKNINIQDIFGLAFELNIDIFYDFFLQNVYTPLANEARKKISKDSVVGLRDKAPEIQEKFLQKKSHEIAFVKQQFLNRESFRNIFKDCCRWRSDLAYECLEVNSDRYSIRSFGLMRTSGLVSGFEASKAPPELIKKCETLISDKNDEDDNWAFPNWAKERPFVGHKALRQRTIYGVIDGQNIPLTRLNIFGRNNEDFQRMSDRIHQWESRAFPGLLHHHSWTHTDPQYIEKCMTLIERLYQNLLDEQNPKEKLNLIARIHWWGCQACPCFRGSAAIMEAICQGLLEGAHLPYRLNPEKPADIYALTEPNETKFVTDYVSLLQSTELD